MYRNPQRTDHNYFRNESNPYYLKKYRRCKVPSCENSTLSNPEKVFLRVPMAGPVRQKWLAAAGVIASPSNYTKTPNYFFCEDHFEIETDIENYMAYKMGFIKRIRVKNGCLPSKFSCQKKEIIPKIIKIDVLQGRNILCIETVMDNNSKPVKPGLILHMGKSLAKTSTFDTEAQIDSGQGYCKEFYKFIKSRLKTSNCQNTFTRHTYDKLTLMREQFNNEHNYCRTQP